jgi:hypothetical protein
VPAAPLKPFIRNLKDLDYTRTRMEKLYLDHRIALRDLHSVYEALFLRAVTSFEVFLEELFISILERKTRYKKQRVSLRMRVTSNEALMEILLQGGKYLDWLPFDRTVNRAKLYLDDGKPFSELTDGDKSFIKTVTTIRHAIAHRGPHAINEFHRTVIGSQMLLPVEKRPAGYLRSQVRAGPTKNRFEVYVTELARIAGDLC